MTKLLHLFLQTTHLTWADKSKRKILSISTGSLSLCTDIHSLINNLLHTLCLQIINNNRTTIPSNIFSLYSSNTPNNLNNLTDFKMRANNLTKILQISSTNSLVRILISEGSSNNSSHNSCLINSSLFPPFSNFSSHSITEGKT